MEVLTGIFTAFGLSASAGLNAYIPLLVVSLMGRYTNWIHLDPPYDALTSGWIIGLLVVLTTVEFFADKIPLVNHVNDAIQTFVRPAAGAIAFAASAQVITGLHPVVALAAGLLIAGTVHVAKAGALRPAVTGVSGGTANVVVSATEDVISTAVSILSILVPVLIGIILIPTLVLLIWWLWQRANRRASAESKA